MRKQKAMKLPKMMPSLRLLVPILEIKPFTPGICAAAEVIRRLILASVSLCMPKFSLIEYACANTPSITLWLWSSRPRSCSMYSASASAGFELRKASMSERTFARRCCRSRASEIDDLSRRSSWRCSVRSSRWRERLFCFSVDVLNAFSESSRRES